ncbi:MAG: replicative DNA helicase [Proteobacteria bacterium]|nr:replicative DNA helicase [Pseudomonadota bacterium]
MPPRKPQNNENQADNALKIPQNFEAELSVLGSMLLDNKVIDLVNEIIQPEDFYNELNKQIYIAMQALHKDNKPVDIATLYARTLNLKQLDDAGGISYLTNLTQRLPSPQNVERYAKIVKDTALLRSVIDISERARVQAQLPIESVTDFINDLNQQVFKLTIEDANRAYYTASEVMKSTFELLDELHNNRDQLPGISSGFRAYDAMTAGFKPGTLTILAARPAMGKTALALNFLANAAIDKRVPSAFFSLEMTKEELGNRLLTSRARVKGESMRTGNLNDQEWNRILQSMEDIMRAPIFVDETPAISITKLAAKARRLKAENNLGLIVIDYLQLMTGSTYTPSREQEISEISRSLKGLSKELKLPIIALAQLNRGVESRPNKRPMLQDLRESGAIEQGADVINFIYRDDYYNEKSEEPGISEIIIAKQRSGKTGTVKLKWLGQYVLFENPPEDPDSVY